MGRKTGIALLILAGVMLYGSLRSSASFAAPATIAAVLITVVLPAAGGAMLLWGGGGRRARRMEDLRQRTVDAEILRLAVREGGRLTANEVATALALSPESAKDALDALMSRDFADIAVSDDGVLVYVFHEKGTLGDKQSARGLLDG